MRQFNLKEAQEGAEVCTRNGRDVRILCYDCKKDGFPIVALVRDFPGAEEVCSYTDKGVYARFSDNTDFDLVMKPVKLLKVAGQPFLNRVLRYVLKMKMDWIKLLK